MCQADSIFSPPFFPSLSIPFEIDRREEEDVNWGAVVVGWLVGDGSGGLHSLPLLTAHVFPHQLFGARNNFLQEFNLIPTQQTKMWP